MAITVKDFQAIVPDSTASLCSGFVKMLLRFPQLFVQWLNQVTASDGSINGALKAGDLIFSAAPLAQDDTRLLCNGQEVAQSQYPALFTAIGTTYGTASSPTNFKLPDFSCRFPVGAGSTTFTSTDQDGNTVTTTASYTLGSAGGEQAHRLIQAELPDCTFPTCDAQNTDTLVSFKPCTLDENEGQSFPSGGGAARRTLGVKSGGNDQAHNNVPPFVVTFVYIKT